MGTRQQHDAATFRYISLANAIPALQRDEELRLASAYRDGGDLRAKDRLVQANLRHVIPHALRYRASGVPLDELIAQGNLALVAALDRFEPERGLRFATYANHWIRAEILGLVLKQRSLVGGGRGPLRGKYVFKLRRELAELLVQLGDREQALQILAERFGRTPEQLRDILGRIEARDASLDAHMGDGGGATLIDMLAHDGQPSDELVVAGQMRREVGVAVREASIDLSARERFIVERRLMADADARMSLTQVGQHFGVSRERARQIEASLKTKLRKRLSATAEAHMA